MAQVAEANGLAIGLKNAVDMIPDVVSSVDFALNEQCHEYGECASYKPFTDQNKAVFNIEYGGNACNSPAGVKLSTLIKNEDEGLSELGGACPGQGVDAPPAVEEPKPSASSSAPIPATTSQVPQPPAAPTTPAEQGQPEDADEAEDEDEDEDEDDKDKKGHPFRWYPKSRPSWRSRPWNRVEK
jgi:hypothetical protein